MNHQDVLDRLSEYLDGGTDPALTRQIETHLDSCEPCQQTLQDVRRIQEAGRDLDVPEPPAHVWRQLAQKLEQRGLFSRRRAFSSPRTLGTFVTWGSAVAAGILLALAAFVALRSSHAPAPPPASENEELARWVGNELQLAEQHYENAISGLEKILDEEPSTLDPQVMTVLRQNLGLLDTAIGESREAVREAPESAIARESLLQALRRKLALLQNTILLINEVRQGRGQSALDLVEQIEKDPS